MIYVFLILIAILAISGVRFWLDIKQSKPLQDYYNDLIDKISDKDKTNQKKTDNDEVLKND